MMEAYDLEQMVACFAGKDMFTLLLLGDVHQRLEQINPAWTRAPWKSEDFGGEAGGDGNVPSTTVKTNRKNCHSPSGYPRMHKLAG